MAGRPARVTARRADVTVRPVTTLAEYRQCMALQQAAFGYEDLFVEPLTQLLTAQRYGGAVLGAFDAAGELVGYLYSCLGRRDGELLHCFRLLAVAPSARGMGVGERLLLALRERAAADGIRTIVATFDPLEPANARLYLGKLGFRGVRYFPNHYGDLGKGRNEGLETDRLEIEWTVEPAGDPAPARDPAEPEAGPPETSRHGAAAAPGTAPEVTAAATPPAGTRAAAPLQPPERRPPASAPRARQELPRVTVITRRRGGWPICTILRLDLDADRLLIEIPASLQALKAADLSLARAWRRWTREAFLAYVGSGRYAAVDFLPAPAGRSEPAYVLERVGSRS